MLEDINTPQKLLEVLAHMKNNAVPLKKEQKELFAKAYRSVLRRYKIARDTLNQATADEELKKLQLLPSLYCNKLHGNKQSITNTQDLTDFIINDDWSFFLVGSYRKKLTSSAAKRQPWLDLSKSPSERIALFHKHGAKQAKRWISRNQLGKATKTLGRTSPPLEITDDVMSQLEELHPPMSAEDQEAISQLPPCVPAESIELKKDEIRKLILQLKPFKEPGLSRYTAETLQSLIKGDPNDPEGEETLDLLMYLLREIIHGDLSPFAIQVMTGSPLLPIAKATGGLPRPIAFPEIMLKLAESILKKHIEATPDADMDKIQYGIGKPFGCELIIHELQQAAENIRYSNFDIVCLDKKNAFNTIRRLTMLRDIKQRRPIYYNYLMATHSKATILWVINESTLEHQSLPSQEGVRQGSALSSNSYCEGERNSLLQLATALQTHGGFAKGYIDDTSAAAPAEHLIPALTEYLLRLKEAGISLSPQKQQVLLAPRGEYELALKARSDYQQLFQLDNETTAKNIRIHPNDLALNPIHNDNSLLDIPHAKQNYGIKCLGGYISPYSEYIQFKLEKKLPELIAKMNQFQLLQNKQEEWTLLQNIISSQVNFIMRTTHPQVIKEMLQAYELDIKQRIERLVDSTVSEEIWEQMKLKIQDGGLSIPHFHDMAISAYLASTANAINENNGEEKWAETSWLRNIHQLKERYTEQCVSEGVDAIETMEWLNKALSLDSKKMQANLMSKLYKIREQLFMNNTFLKMLSKERRATFLSIKDQHAGAWLRASTVIPENRMHDEEFAVALRIRFYLNIAPHLLTQGKTFKCSCTERAIIDNKGLHFCKCKKGGGVTKRHDTVHHTLHQMLAATGVPAKKEPTSKGFASASQFRNHKGEQLRPDTIELVANNFYDTMIPDSRSPTYTDPNGHNSANTQGFAAKKGEISKINHYKDITDIGIWKFYPLIIESMGKFSEGTLSTVKKWASQIAMRADVEYGLVKRRWIERISVALQKGNAAIINGKLEKLAKYYYNIPGRYDNMDMFIMRE